MSTSLKPDSGQDARFSSVLNQNAPDRPEERAYVATQWQLMWWRFRRHKVAMIGGIVTILIYLVALFAEFLAPFPVEAYSSKYLYAPPQRLHFLDRREGGVRFDPHVLGYTSKVDPVAFRRTFEVDESQYIPVRFFVRGAPYRLFGLIPGRLGQMVTLVNPPVAPLMVATRL